MTDLFAPFTKTVNANAALLVDVNSGICLLVNRDTANSIFIGGDLGVSPTNLTDTAVIDPLGSVQVDTSRGPIYAVCSAGQSAVCQVIPGGDSYSPSPVLIAEQILNSGTIIVDNPVVLVNSQSFTLPASPGTKHFGPFLVNTFQSWTLNFSFNGSGLTVPYVAARFRWTVDAAGLIDAEIEDWVWPIDNANFGQFVGHGPMHGPYMWVDLDSYDSAGASMNFTLSGSTRPVTETSIRSTGLVAPPGLGTDDVLGFYTNNALGIGATSPVQVVNLYNGPVRLRFRSTASGITVNSVNVNINYNPNTDFSGTNGLILTGPAVASGTSSPEQEFDLFLPKRPCTFTVTNNFTAAVSVRVFVVAKGAVL